MSSKSLPGSLPAHSVDTPTAQRGSSSRVSIPATVRTDENRRWRRLVHGLLPFALPVLLIAVWQLLSTTGWLASQILPSPAQVLEAFFRLLGTGELISNIAISAQRALSGFAIGGGLGFLLGAINGISRLSEKISDSSIQMIRNIPHLALIPLVIVWFGIGEEAKLFLVALGVFFPMYLNTFHGIRSVDPGLIEMGRVYGLSRIALYVHVILPGALPSILVGIRYALGIMWLTLIVAETVAADSGIGYMAMNAREFMQMDVIVLSIVLYALLGKLSDSIAKLLEKRWLRWNPSLSRK